MSNTPLRKVYAVDEVDVTLTRTDPVGLSINARGRVITSGWSNADFSQYVYLAPPADGVQEFDFIARAPASGVQVLQLISPISVFAEIFPIDIESYWGPDQPLKGIRIYSARNSKLVEIRPPEEIVAMAGKRMPQAIAEYLSVKKGGILPSYAADIKPLFRERDVTGMMWRFDLHKYEEVKSNAEFIYERLQEDMPCDGLWPDEDIAEFKAWMDSGMQP